MHVLLTSKQVSGAYFKVLPAGERSILPLGGAAPKAGKTASKGVGDDVLSMNR